MGGFKGGEHRVSPILSYLMLIKGTKGHSDVIRMERHSLDLPQAVKNKVGCESVWNS